VGEVRGGKGGRKGRAKAPAFPLPLVGCTWVYCSDGDQREKGAAQGHAPSRDAAQRLGWGQVPRGGRPGVRTRLRRPSLCHTPGRLGACACLRRPPLRRIPVPRRHEWLELGRAAGPDRQ